MESGLGRDVSFYLLSPAFTSKGVQSGLNAEFLVGRLKAKVKAQRNSAEFAVE